MADVEIAEYEVGSKTVISGGVMSSCIPFTSTGIASFPAASIPSIRIE